MEHCGRAFLRHVLPALLRAGQVEVGTLKLFPFSMKVNVNVQGILEMLQGRHKGREVCRGHRSVQATYVGSLLIGKETGGGYVASGCKGVDSQTGGRQVQFQFVQVYTFWVGSGFQSESFQAETTLLVEAHAANLRIEGVLLQGFERNCGREFTDSDMLRIELTGGIGLRQYVVVHLPTAYQHRVDTQVEVVFFFVVSFEAKVSIRN